MAGCRSDEYADGFEDDVIAAEQALAQASSNISELINAIAERYIQEHGFQATKETLEKVLTEAFKAGQRARTAPKAKTTNRTRENSKQAQMIALLQRPDGATIEQISEVTGWNGNTVRGAMSGALKKRLGLNVVVINRLRNVGPHARGGFSVYQIAG